MVDICKWWYMSLHKFRIHYFSTHNFKSFVLSCYLHSYGLYCCLFFRSDSNLGCAREGLGISAPFSLQREMTLRLLMELGDPARRRTHGHWTWICIGFHNPPSDRYTSQIRQLRRRLGVDFFVLALNSSKPLLFR